MLIPLGREKIVLYSEIAGAIVDLILNALLIPNMASAGAAIGTLAAEAVVLIIQYAALREEVSCAYKEVKYGTILLATVLATIGSIWVKKISFGNFITLMISAILFFAIYSIVLLLRKEPLTNEIRRQIFEKIKMQKNCK